MDEICRVDAVVLDNLEQRAVQLGQLVLQRDTFTTVVQKPHGTSQVVGEPVESLFGVSAICHIERVDRHDITFHARTV